MGTCIVQVKWLRLTFDLESYFRSLLKFEFWCFFWTSRLIIIIIIITIIIIVIVITIIITRT